MSVSRHERGSTLHGTRRVRERMKLPARAVKRLVDRARAEGLPFDLMPGWLQLAVQHKRQLHPPGTEYLYYRGYLFVFAASGKLITTFPMQEDEPEDAHVDWNHARKSRKFFD